jgi:hypothetical protein
LTLTPSQWDTVFEAIPSTFTYNGHAYTLEKILADQYINEPKRPVMVIRTLSQGKEITPVQQLSVHEGDLLEGDASKGDAYFRRVWYGQICRARINVQIESFDLNEARSLASCLSQDLQARELEINPYADDMQFRGVDPPEASLPYYSAKAKKFVQRYSLIFSVDYRFKWSRDYPVIREFEIEMENAPPPNIYHGVSRESKNYSLDVIIVR